MRLFPLIESPLVLDHVPSQVPRTLGALRDGIESLGHGSVRLDRRGDHFEIGVTFGVKRVDADSPRHGYEYNASGLWPVR